MIWIGVSPEEGTGATISDDNDDQVYSDTNIFDGSFDEQVFYKSRKFIYEIVSQQKTFADIY